MNKAAWDNPHTFEEGKQYLAEGNPIDYEVSVNGCQGALMTRSAWIEAVKDGTFIDYDGYGSMLTEHGKFIGGNVHPSSAAMDLVQYPETAYILWYNR
jgi:hypothetical protein